VFLSNNYYCDVTAHAILFCFCAGVGSLMVCSGFNSYQDRDCYVAIDGLDWSNYGLTYMERIQKMSKYLVTGVVPKRTLWMPRHVHSTLIATDKGR
jgi:hypothetical protein